MNNPHCGKRRRKPCHSPQDLISQAADEILHVRETTDATELHRTVVLAVNYIIECGGTYLSVSAQVDFWTMVSQTSTVSFRSGQIERLRRSGEVHRIVTRSDGKSDLA